MNRNLFNCVMIALLLAVMNYRFTENAIHEGIGVALGALLWLHNFWNWRSYQVIGKKRAGLRRCLTGAVNVLLSAVLLIVLASGVLVSQTIFASLDLRLGLVVYELHGMMAYGLFLLIAVHLGLHWELLRAKLGVEDLSGSFRFTFGVAVLSVMAYGVKASFARHIGDKLLMERTFDRWSEAPSLIGFTLEHLAIMGLYGGMTYCAVCFFRHITRRFSPEGRGIE